MSRNLAALAFALVVPVHPAHAFNALTSPDGVHVLAVGDTGSIYRSWNGGEFWSSAVIGSRDLHDVAMRGFTVIAPAEDGYIWRSADSGGNWDSLAVAGAAHLRGVSMPDDSTAYVVGDGGRVLVSSDNGATWTPSFPTSRDLLAVHFLNALEGWAVGESLTVLHTLDGGATWVVLNEDGADDFVDVHANGSHMWAVGRRGVVMRSTDGVTLQPVIAPVPDFVGFDAVWMQSADTVIVAGGGGFVRRTTNAGATWEYARQPAFTALSDLYFIDAQRGWASATRGRLVLATLDGGLTWAWPGGTVDGSMWQQTLQTSGMVRGSTISANRQGGPNSLYCAVANRFYRSTDYGDSWVSIQTLPQFTKINAFIVSPKDSMLMVAAIGTPDQIIRSDDGGQTWGATLIVDFSEYGTPVEMNPDKPDTLFFAPEDSTLYMSTNFGATWNAIAPTPFRSPCDITITPDNNDNMWVGDGVTGDGLGQIFQSLDGGLTWALRFTSGTGSEIPAMSVAPLQTQVGFGTQWNTGGVARTRDGGTTWEVIVNTGTAWGAICAPDDPMVFAFGVFSGATTYLSSAQGVPFTSYPTTSSNYSLYARDRGSFLATQTFGVYKFYPRYELPLMQAQVLNLSAPNGGELWEAGTPQQIQWAPFGLFQVALEWQPDTSSPWDLIAMVPGYTGNYEWTPPLTPTSQARVRIRDAWDDVPEDISALSFSILAPGFVLTPAPVLLGKTTPGGMLSGAVTLQNTGNGTLNVSNIAVNRSDFWTGRTSTTIAPGSSDTIGVHYLPLIAGLDTAIVSFTTNATTIPLELQVIGNSLPPAITLQQNRPNPFKGVTLIRYALPTAAHVELEVFNLQGQRVATLVNSSQAAGEYSVSFGPNTPSVNGSGRSALPAGVYFYRFRAGATELRRKMVMLR